MPAENVWFPNVCTKCARHTRASLRPWLIIMIVIVGTGRQGLPLSWRVPTRHTDIRYDNLHATDSIKLHQCPCSRHVDGCVHHINLDRIPIYLLNTFHTSSPKTPLPEAFCHNSLTEPVDENGGTHCVYQTCKKRYRRGFKVGTTIALLTSCSTARRLVQGPQTTAMRWIPKILDSKWKIVVWEPCICTHCDRCEAPWMSRHLKWYYYWYNSYRKPVKPTRTTNEEPKT